MQNRYIIYICYLCTKVSLLLAHCKGVMYHMSIVLENILRFVSKGYSFKFPRLGGTNPNSGILYIPNAKACCSGCVSCPSFSSACFKHVWCSGWWWWCVCVYVYTYIYVHMRRIHVYTYITSPSRSQSSRAIHKVALHRCPAWSSLPEPTLKQGALLVLLIGFISVFLFFFKTKLLQLQVFCIT